jgi:hypothetical protein
MGLVELGHFSPWNIGSSRAHGEKTQLLKTTSAEDLVYL